MVNQEPKKEKKRRRDSVVGLEDIPSYDTNIAASFSLFSPLLLPLQYFFFPSPSTLFALLCLDSRKETLLYTN